jgi:hypothetical protein
MKALVTLVLFLVAPLSGAPPCVPRSASPDGRFALVLDIDRDPTIEATWQGDGFPKLEITELTNGKIVGRIEYRGDTSDRTEVKDSISTLWRPDGSAVAVSFRLAHGFASSVCLLNEDGRFSEARFPTYLEMTGMAEPAKVVSGSDLVEAWEANGQLRLYVFRRSSRKDGIDLIREHRIWLSVDSTGMVVQKAETAEKAANQALQTTPVTSRLCGRTFLCDRPQRGV